MKVQAIVVVVLVVLGIFTLYWFDPSNVAARETAQYFAEQRAYEQAALDASWLPLTTAVFHLAVIALTGTVTLGGCLTIGIGVYAWWRRAQRTVPNQYGVVGFTDAQLELVAVKLAERRMDVLTVAAQHPQLNDNRVQVLNTAASSAPLPEPAAVLTGLLDAPVD